MAVWYVNQNISPSEESDSYIGTEGTGKLRNSWADVTWTAGDRYYQAAGISTTEQIAVGGSGAAGNPITIGKYGRDLPNPVVGNGQQYGIYLNVKHYLNIADIDVAGCTSHGVYVRSGGGSNLQQINFRRMTSRNNGGTGFRLDSIVLNGSINNCLLEDCYGDTNGEHGFDAVGVVQTIRWRYSRARRNGSLILGHGFSVHPFISNNVTSGWTATGVGTSYSRTTSASEDVQKVINRTAGVVLTKNPGAGSAVAANQWDQASPGATLYINTGGNPNGVNMAWKRGPHGPFYFEHNQSWENSTAAGAGEGHGFAADDMTSSVTYDDNLAWDNEGAGFQCQWTDSIINRNGIAFRNALSNFRTTGYTTTLLIERAVALLGKQHGFFFDQPFTDVTIRNSIACYNALNGIIGAAVGVVADNNCTYSNTSGDTNNVTNTNGVLLNPLFRDLTRPWLGLLPTTPCYNTGLYIAGARDRYGRRFVDRNIGPWARF